MGEVLRRRSKLTNFTLPKTFGCNVLETSRRCIVRRTRPNVSAACKRETLASLSHQPTPLAILVLVVGLQEHHCTPINPRFLVQFKGKMAPSFDNLTEDNGTYDSEEEIDFSGARFAQMLRYVDGWLMTLQT